MRNNEVNKKQCLIDFMDMVAQTADETVRDHVPVKEVASNNILLIRSVKCDLFYTIVDAILQENPESHIYVLGDINDLPVLKTRGLSNENLYMHQNRLDSNLANTFKPLINELKIDTICFATYSVFRESYLNVVAFCNQLIVGSENEIKVYGNIASTLELFEVKDIALYMQSIRLSKELQGYGTLLIEG